MSEARRAPAFPSISLELLEDLSPENGAGFLRLVRRRLRAHYPDGSASAPFLYDEVHRHALDAVVMAAHYVGVRGRSVLLRSSIRPPIYFRDLGDSSLETPRRQLWELPAGLAEPDERGEDGLRRAAVRELHEETGFEPALERLAPLGPSLYACPGVIGERLFFFEVEVDPGARVDPPLDGSALERFGEVIDVPLAVALDMCRRGEIEDVKTEVGLRRLSEKYS